MDRINLSTREAPFYQTLYSLAKPDTSGYISGTAGAEFLQLSGLNRDVLHTIWSLADSKQEGRLNMDRFFVALRLIAHAQSGMPLAATLISIVPPSLPIFEGLASRRDQNDALSISDVGHHPHTASHDQNIFATMDMERAADLSFSMQKLGLDPLTFTPFATGPLTPTTRKDTEKVSPWELSESDKSKYSELFARLDSDNDGMIDGKTARSILQRSGVAKSVLALIWELSDLGKDGNLNEAEFICAMHLTSKCKRGFRLPPELPQELAKLFTSKKIPHFGNDEIGDLAAVADEAEELFSIEEEDTSNLQAKTLRLVRATEVQRKANKDLEIQSLELEERLRHLEEKRRSLNLGKISEKRDHRQLELQLDNLKKSVEETEADLAELQSDMQRTRNEIEDVVASMKPLETERDELLRTIEDEELKLRLEISKSNELQAVQEIRDREEQLKQSMSASALQRSKTLSVMQAAPAVTEKEAKAEGHTWATQILTKAPLEQKKSSVGFGANFFDDRAR